MKMTMLGILLIALGLIFVLMDYMNRPKQNWAVAIATTASTGDKTWAAAIEASDKEAAISGATAWAKSKDPNISVVGSSAVQFR